MVNMSQLSQTRTSPMTSHPALAKVQRGPGQRGGQLCARGARRPARVLPLLRGPGQVHRALEGQQLRCAQPYLCWAATALSVLCTLLPWRLSSSEVERMYQHQHRSIRSPPTTLHLLCIAPPGAQPSTWERIIRHKAPVMEPRDSQLFQV